MRESNNVNVNRRKTYCKIVNVYVEHRFNNLVCLPGKLTSKNNLKSKPHTPTTLPGRLHDPGTEVASEAARRVAEREGGQLSKQRGAQGVVHPEEAADGRHGHGRPRWQHARLRLHHLGHFGEHFPQVGTNLIIK